MRLPDVDDWEEARPPHLPDRMTAVPWLAWVFILLAIFDLGWLIDQARFGAGAGLTEIVVFLLGAIPSVVAFLLPAALLARHPDARLHASVLFYGTILLALAQGLRILADPLQSIFEQLTPPADDLQFLVPSAAAYSLLVATLMALGLADIGWGLARARRYEDRRSALVRLLVPIATLLASLSAVSSVVQVAQGDTTITPTYAVYIGGAVVVGILRIVAWAFLTAAAIRGWTADEDPGIGWRLAALGGGFVLVAIALSTAESLLQIQDASLWIFYLTGSIFALGHLCLLAGFALGLPALEPLETLDDEPGRDPAPGDDLGMPAAEAPVG
jgi:hypothetical protein